MMAKKHMPVALAMVGLVLASCQEKTSEQAEKSPRPVLVIEAHQRQHSDVVFAGVIDSRYRTDLAFRTLGRIDRRLVNVGDTVQRGEMLASLDPMIMQQNLRSAQASVDTTTAQLEAAEVTDDRNTRLAVNRAISTADADASRAAHDVAKASLVQAKAELAQAQEQLAYARLTSEYDGVVTAVQAEVGQVVASGTTVMTVARTDTLEAIIDVPLAIADDLKPGMGLAVHLQIAPTVQGIGVVREIAPSADPTIRTRRVRLELRSPPQNFRIGSTVTVVWNRLEAYGIELPATALLVMDGHDYVWVVDRSTQTVARRQVEIADNDGKTIRISSGLKDGDEVVSAGVNSLKDGEVIVISTENSN